MSLTARSNELEITPASFVNTHLARAGWYSRGFPTSSFFGKLRLEWKLLPWPMGVAAPAIGGIGLIDAGAGIPGQESTGRGHPVPTGVRKRYHGGLLVLGRVYSSGSDSGMKTRRSGMMPLYLPSSCLAAGGSGEDENGGGTSMARGVSAR